VPSLPDLPADLCNGFALDYLEEMFSNFDNFISRGTDTFINGKSQFSGKGFQEMLYEMVSKSLKEFDDGMKRIRTFFNAFHPVFSTRFECIFSTVGETNRSAVSMACLVFENCPTNTSVDLTVKDYVRLIWGKWNGGFKERKKLAKKYPTNSKPANLFPFFLVFKVIFFEISRDLSSVV
jgi:hypothetical protein